MRVHSLFSRLWLGFTEQQACAQQIGPWEIWMKVPVMYNLILVIGGWGISCEIVLRCMSLDLTDAKSTLVQVMAWCRQATSHCLSQCWTTDLSRHMASLGRNELHCILKRKTHWFNYNINTYKFRILLFLWLGGNRLYPYSELRQWSWGNHMIAPTANKANLKCMDNWIMLIRHEPMT